MTVPTNPMDLTTVADFIATLSLDNPVPTQVQSDLYQRLITGASVFLQTQLGRNFAQSEYIEYRNGTGSHVMAVGNYPIVNIVNIIIDSMTIPISDQSNPASVGYLFDAKFIYLKGYKFCKGIQNIYLAYNAGYAEIPADVAQYCIELAGRKMKQYAKGGERLGVNMTVIGQQNISYEKSDLTDTFKSLLRQYQKVVPV